MLGSYADVQTFIKDVMAQLGADATFAPHEEFWRALSYQEFVDGNVPNIGGAPVKILVKGNSAESAIIQALKGEGLFAPGARFRRMPGGGPFFSAQQIQEVADWIDAGCPETQQAPSA
jgi:hypothetical protein